MPAPSTTKRAYRGRDPHEVLRRNTRDAVRDAELPNVRELSFLLANGVPASAVRWDAARPVAVESRALAASARVFSEDARRARRMVEMRVWLRLDARVWPTMQHGATVSERELEQLRAASAVIRLGRVRYIERDRLVLERGDVALQADTLIVDCTASALARNVNDPTPVFAPGKIALQMVRI